MLALLGPDLGRSAPDRRRRRHDRRRATPCRIPCRATTGSSAVRPRRCAFRRRWPTHGSRSLVESPPRSHPPHDDGYANSFASPSWRTDAGLDLRNHVRRDGLADVAKKLPSWLADSAIAGGDDVSMALLQRSDQAAAPAAAGAIASGAGTSAATSSTSSSARRSGVIAIGIVALVLGVAAGGAGGWALAGGDETTTSTTVATIPSTSTTTPTTEASTTLPITIGPDQTLAVAHGPRGSAVVTHNMNVFTVPNDPRMVVVRTVDESQATELPNRWTLVGDQLRYRGNDKVTTTYWTVVGDFLWSTDLETTTVFNTSTGKVVASSSDGAGAVDGTSNSGAQQAPSQN